MLKLAAIQMAPTHLSRKTKTIAVCYSRTIECETCWCKVGIQQQLAINFPSPFLTTKITTDCDYSEMHICSSNFKSIHFKLIIQNKGLDTYCHIEFWMPRYCSNEKLILVRGPQWVNSLAPVRSECDYKNVIFNLVLLIGIFRSSHDNALWWMPHDLTDDKSTLVQVMAWCRQATSHCLGQCWPRSLSPYRFRGHNELKRCGGNKSSAELTLIYRQWDT